MTTLAHRAPSPFSEMLEWLDTTPLRTAWKESFLPVEEYAEDGRYVIRADLPGIDPDKDVKVTIDDDVLTIHAERREEEHDKHRSEVRYGSFTRQVRLPRGCKQDDVTASYAAGVLEVSVPLAEPASEPIEIPVGRSGD